MNTHFCGGQAVETSFSLGVHNPDCGMGDMEEACSIRPVSETQFNPQPCCENQHDCLQFDENTQLEKVPPIVSPVFLAAFVSAFSQSIALPTAHYQHVDYTPPAPPDKDIQVLFQTFLL